MNRYVSQHSHFSVSASRVFCWKHFRRVPTNELRSSQSNCDTDHLASNTAPNTLLLRTQTTKTPEAVEYGATGFHSENEQKVWLVGLPESNGDFYTASIAGDRHDNTFSRLFLFDDRQQLISCINWLAINGS